MDPLAFVSGSIAPRPDLKAGLALYNVLYQSIVDENKLASNLLEHRDKAPAPEQRPELRRRRRPYDARERMKISEARKLGGCQSCREKKTSCHTSHRLSIPNSDFSASSMVSPAPLSILADKMETTKPTNGYNLMKFSYEESELSDKENAASVNQHIPPVQEVPSLQSIYEGLFSDGIWHCNCQPRLPATKFQVKKETRNYRRWFYKCQVSKDDGGCGFFLWNEKAINREGKVVLGSSGSERSPEVGKKSSVERNERTPTATRKRSVQVDLESEGSSEEDEFGSWPLSPETRLEHHHDLKSNNLLWKHKARQPRALPTKAPQIQNRRKALRILINKTEHLACPDSGSEKNIISSTFAHSQKYKIYRSDKDIKAFEVGNGKIVYSIGRVRERVMIPGHPMRRKKIWFYVLENCPMSVILGFGFLRRTEILTVNRRFLEECTKEMSSISSLLWIGSPRKGGSMKCTIDGRELEGQADTGSDLNLMSLACAERENFKVDRRKEARSLIKVGNGEVIETIGQVYVSNLGLDWRKPESGHHIPLENPPLEVTIPHEDDELEAIFHVVENLPCDIIFGHQLLYDTDAFNRCPELLLNPHPPPNIYPNLAHETHNRPFDLKVYIALPSPTKLFSKLKEKTKRKPKPNLNVDVELGVGVVIENGTAKERHDNDVRTEARRRLMFSKDRIAEMPDDEREARRRGEEEKERKWEVVHSTCGFC